MKILLIEDDEATAEFVGKGLRSAGHEVIHRGDGRSGQQAAANDHYDVVVLDRMLPELDGLSMLADLRQAGNRTPVLILSALSQVDERVKGLRTGGDDYLSKPFAFPELLARVEVLARRHATEGGETRLSVGDLELDLLKREVRRSGQVIDLQPREFKLLEYLARHAGQVVTRAMLLEHVWDVHFDPMTNVIDVHISRLRQKLDRGFTTPLVQTVRGAGYRLASHG